jgi:hypothetical protein
MAPSLHHLRFPEAAQLRKQTHRAFSLFIFFSQRKKKTRGFESAKFKKKRVFAGKSFLDRFFLKKNGERFEAT